MSVSIAWVGWGTRPFHRGLSRGLGGAALVTPGSIVWVVEGPCVMSGDYRGLGGGGFCPSPMQGVIAGVGRRVGEMCPSDRGSS